MNTHVFTLQEQYLERNDKRFDETYNGMSKFGFKTFTDSGKGTKLRNTSMNSLRHFVVKPKDSN